MSFEAELKQRYAQAHHRLFNPPPRPKPVPPEPPKLQTPKQRPLFQLTTPLTNGYPNLPKLHTVLAAVSEAEGIEISRIVGVRKQASIVIARQTFCYLAYYYTRASLSQIGKVIGGKDHTTILYSVRAIERRCNENEAWRIRLKAVSDRLVTKLSPLSTTPIPF